MGAKLQNATFRDVLKPYSGLYSEAAWRTGNIPLQENVISDYIVTQPDIPHQQDKLPLYRTLIFVTIRTV